MTRKTWSLVTALGLGAVLALAGCGAKVIETQSSGQESAPNQTSNDSGASNAAAVVDFTNEKGQIVCPVSGDTIADKSKAAGFEDYNGKRYYFCCGMCPPEFKKDPAKWADGKAIKEGTTIKM